MPPAPSAPRISYPPSVVPGCMEPGKLTIRRAMKLLLASAAIGALAFAADTATQRGRPPSRARTETRTLTFGGALRRYLVHVPDSPAGALVLAFHGGQETPENQQQISHFDAISD